MRFGHIELPVANPLASRDWYVEHLGFELEVNQGDRFIWLRCGGVELLLRPGDLPGLGQPRGTLNHVLYSDDLEVEVARLRERGVRLHGQGACFHFQDPDGHWWQLVDPGADHSAPASGEAEGEAS